MVYTHSINLITFPAVMRAYMSYTFFTESLKKIRQVGSVVPSSRFLAASICDQIDFTSAISIVELGPGTGPMTRLILPRMNDQCRLLCIEQNNTFAEQLESEIKDARIRVVQGEAQNLKKHMNDHGIAQVDCIVSSLPLSNMSMRMKMRILRACKDNLKPGGQFIQYQYSLADRKTVQRYFTRVEMDFVLINFPPAFIYSCAR